MATHSNIRAWRIPWSEEPGGLQSMESQRVRHDFFAKFSCSVVSDSATPWTVARQAPQTMGFSRQEYWSGLPFPPPGDLPDPGIEPTSPASSALAGGPSGKLSSVQLLSDLRLFATPWTAARQASLSITKS